MDLLINAFKGVAGQSAGAYGQPRIGVVTSFDPQTYSARLRIQPEDTLTGWLPILAIWAGAGWGLACPPAPGDQVVMIGQEGDTQQGIILGRLWSAKTMPPAAPSGALWLVHGSGSCIKLNEDGSIESTAPNWVHHGNLQVSGDVSDGEGSLNRLRQHYDMHSHPTDGAMPAPQD